MPINMGGLGEDLAENSDDTYNAVTEAFDALVEIEESIFDAIGEICK